MLQCPACRTEVDGRALVCPACHATYETSSEYGRHRYIVKAAILGGMGAAVVGLVADGLVLALLAVPFGAAFLVAPLAILSTKSPERLALADYYRDPTARWVRKSEGKGGTGFFFASFSE